MRQFAKYVLRKFFETFQTNSKVVVELLFWKTNKEAQQITEGYAMMRYVC
jgi:timeless